MKTRFIVIGIIITAALLMSLPYLLRDTSVQESLSNTIIPSAPVSNSPVPATSSTPISTPATLTTTTPTPTVSTTPAKVSIVISNFKFSPQNITVKKGTKITWTNNDSVSHTVTGDNGGPASSLLNPGLSYSYVFNTIGTYKYHCSPHPFMTGEVNVTE